MIFRCQSESLQELERLCKADRHSILIEGPPGCGKSYLSKSYANMLNIEDIVFVSPSVSDIKSTIDQCFNHTNPIVIIIENLDCGVVAAAYSLLKFLEEPNQNIYIVITCRNINNVPDTIISRSAVINISNPLPEDVFSYVNSLNSSKCEWLKTQPIFNAARSFGDIDTLLKMTDAQIEYIHNLKNISDFEGSVSNLSWQLSHYSDGSEMNVRIALQFLITIAKTKHIRDACISALQDISGSRLGQSAVLSKLVFECKYCI